jgi:8-oxo-dGTP pyrophosphatase MutT (NUDIX family)
MATSQYVKDLRKKIGNDLLLIPGVAALITDDIGRILCQRTKDGVWSLPAGAIDPGEKPAEAVVREVYEETGLIARPISIRGVVGGPPEYRLTYPNGDVVESTTVVFYCAVQGGELKPQDDESTRLEYFAPAEMPELGTSFPKDFFTHPSASAFFDWDEGWLSQLK